MITFGDVPDSWWTLTFDLPKISNQRGFDHQAAHYVPFVVTVYISLIKAPLMKDRSTDVEFPLCRKLLNVSCFSWHSHGLR